MQPQTTFSNAPITTSFTKNSTMAPKHEENLMKSLMQQSCLHKVSQGKQKMDSIPGWSIPPNSGNQNLAEPIIDIKNLPAGSYYGKSRKAPLMTQTNPSHNFSDDAPVYIDPATGKEIPAAEIEQFQAPTELGVAPNVTVTLASQCTDQNCSNCIKKN